MIGPASCCFILCVSINTQFSDCISLCLELKLILAFILCKKNKNVIKINLDFLQFFLNIE